MLYLKDVSALLYQLWIELRVPGTEQAVCHVQALPIQAASEHEIGHDHHCGKSSLLSARTPTENQSLPCDKLGDLDLSSFQVMCLPELDHLRSALKFVSLDCRDGGGLPHIFWEPTQNL